MPEASGSQAFGRVALTAARMKASYVIEII